MAITTKNLFTENLKLIGEIDNLHYDLKWYEIYKNAVMIRFGVLVKWVTTEQYAVQYVING